MATKASKVARDGKVGVSKGAGGHRTAAPAVLGGESVADSPSASSPSAYSRRTMRVSPAHKYDVGQTVRLSPNTGEEPTPGGMFCVVRQMPAERNEFGYRVKSLADGQERAVRESQLEQE